MSFSIAVWRLLRRVLFLFLLLVPSPLMAGSTVWVVDPCRCGAWRIDAVTEQVLGFVDLSDGDPASAPDPTGLAFSSVPGAGAEWVFVAQGPYLRVLRADTGALARTLDLATALGLPGLELYRIDAAPARWAKDPLGNPRWQSTLWITANLEIAPEKNEPRFIVLDQDELIAGTPFYLVGHGSLCPPENDSCGYRALDIRVTSGKTAYLVQTALVSAVAGPGGEDVALLAVSRDLSPEGPWRVRLLRREKSSATATPINGVDAPQARPGGHVAIQGRSRVVNALDAGAWCAMPDPVTDVAIWGPGPRGRVDGGKDARVYHDLVLLAPGSGARGLLVSIPAGTCVDPHDPGTTQVEVGRFPAGITLTSRLRDDAVILVANHDDGTVSVVGYDELGGDARTLVLDAGSCPTDIAAGQEKARSWEIDDLRFLTGPDGADPRLEWSAGPMPDGTVYRVYEAPLTPDRNRSDGGVAPPKPTGPWIPLGETTGHSWYLDLDPVSRAYLVEIME